MANNVLIKPLVTEKLSAMIETNNYAFMVRKDANKVEIKKAIQEKYPDVKIKAVRTMIVRGKRKSQNSRSGPIVGKTSSYKKAIVTLTTDSEEIDFFGDV